MDAVLFFQSTTGKAWRQKLAGAFAGARERGWLLQVAGGGDSPARIREALRTWSPVGCLVDRAQCSGRPPDAAFGDLPVVYLDQDPARPSDRHPCVLHDSAATARAAARELLGTGRTSFGFVGSDPARFWSREREAAFRAAVRAAGGRFSAYRRGPLGAWLAALPMRQTLKGTFITAVHATLDSPDSWGYIFDEHHAQDNFSYQFTPLCFIGHSHVPVGFCKKPITSFSDRMIETILDWEARNVSESRFGKPESITLNLETGYKYLLNVGSVGQPRNRDPRASFAIYDSDMKTVTRYSLPYDIPAAQQKILAAGLPERLATRLAAGI